MTRLQQNYHQIEQLIAQAAHAAARKTGSVHLVAVSKTFPADDIRQLYAEGQRAFGENYIQEWHEKTELLSDLPEIEWHIIGNIQSNKTKLVAERAHWVHTIDQLKTARRLNEQRPAGLPPLQVCVEVNIAAEPNKHGVTEQKAIELALAVSDLPNLAVRGFMCVAKAGSSEAELLDQFNRMQTLQKQAQAAGIPADVLSMGMSADMATAISCGATHIRIGSAIFGHRDTPSQNNVIEDSLK